MPLAISPAMLHAEAAKMSPATEIRRADPQIGWKPYAAMMAGEGADLWSTFYALDQGNTREANPAMAALGPIGMAAAKVGTGVTLGWLMRNLDKSGHDKTAKTIGYLAGIGLGTLAAHNVRVAKR